MQLKVYEIAWGETVTSTGAIAGDVVTYNITFSDQGVQGPTGSVGLTGPSNVLNIGTVTTGAAGSNASATITGTSPSQTLNLTVPRGNTGATGSQGPVGPANSLAIGTVTTGAAGSSASAAITGAAPNQTLSLTIPQGLPGTGLETLTTQGDTLYRGASTGERLPIGTTGQVLKVSASGIPEWGAESGAVSSVAGRTGAVTLAVADVADAVATSDARLSDARTPSSTLSHASTHHTGGTDAIAPNNIGATWAQVLSTETITGNTTLSSGRNRRITLIGAGATANVDLPSSGNQAGDVVTLLSLFYVASVFTIRRASGTPPFATLATLNASGQAFTFVSDGTAQGWSLVPVDTHEQPASTITGLATVATSGDYDDLTNKPTLGNSAALDVGTTTGTVAAGDDARFTDNRDPNLHAASHAAGRKAIFVGTVAGMTTPVTILADNAGTAGNSITLSFNGSQTIENRLSAWNSANPSNSAEIDAGDGDQTPNNGQTITLSQGTAVGSDAISSPHFTNLSVGNGKTINLGDNYGQFTSASGNAGFTINRGSTGGYASIDLLQEADPSTGWSVQMQPSSNDLQIVNRAAGPTQLLLPASGTTAIKAEGNIEIADTDNGTKATLVAYTNLTDDRTYTLPDADGTLVLDSSLGTAAAADIGTGAGDVCAGDDTRLSDTRDPNTHAASHAAAGSDPVFDQDLNTGDSVTFEAVTVTDLLSPSGALIGLDSGLFANSDQETVFVFSGAALDLYKPVEFLGDDSATNAETTRTNLGLGTAATVSVNELTTNTITLSSSNHNPAAGGQNYYISTTYDLAPVTNPTLREFQVPVNSLITGISVSIHVGGTLGASANSASIALYNKNTATSQTLLNTGIVFSTAANSTSVSGLSVPMTASTPYVIEVTTPIFTTTPTTVRYAVILYFQKQ